MDGFGAILPIVGAYEESVPPARVRRARGVRTSKPQRQPLPRYSLFGLRDDRVGSDAAVRFRPETPGECRGTAASTAKVRAGRDSRRESQANPSLDPNSLLAGKIQGI